MKIYLDNLETITINTLIIKKAIAELHLYHESNRVRRRNKNTLHQLARPLPHLRESHSLTPLKIILDLSFILQMSSLISVQLLNVFHYLNHNIRTLKIPLYNAMTIVSMHAMKYRCTYIMSSKSASIFYLNDVDQRV